MGLVDYAGGEVGLDEHVEYVLVFLSTFEREVVVVGVRSGKFDTWHLLSK